MFSTEPPVFDCLTGQDRPFGGFGPMVPECAKPCEQFWQIAEEARERV